ncbi:hypothetical protein EJ04DRAFT_112869 [Polyplosphaeria fusca]|uniref:Uncharacterized protein n=1 Tax=Polyplosphaeria fusca TaxID=682080 RepID=A0A9P4RCP1_9PLEO|nr:hypothetical protein EJ04DRAFT_112869 [Polyplosphaeria fusca]
MTSINHKHLVAALASRLFRLPSSLIDKDFAHRPNRNPAANYITSGSPHARQSLTRCRVNLLTRKPILAIKTSRGVLLLIQTLTLVHIDLRSSEPNTDLDEPEIFFSHVAQRRQRRDCVTRGTHTLLSCYMPIPGPIRL